MLIEDLDPEITDATETEAEADLLTTEETLPETTDASAVESPDISRGTALRAATEEVTMAEGLPQDRLTGEEETDSDATSESTLTPEAEKETPEERGLPAAAHPTQSDDRNFLKSSKHMKLNKFTRSIIFIINNSLLKVHSYCLYSLTIHYSLSQKKLVEF